MFGDNHEKNCSSDQWWRCSGNECSNPCDSKNIIDKDYVTFGKVINAQIDVEMYLHDLIENTA